MNCIFWKSSGNDESVTIKISYDLADFIVKTTSILCKAKNAKRFFLENFRLTVLFFASNLATGVYAV